MIADLTPLQERRVSICLEIAALRMRVAVLRQVADLRHPTPGEEDDGDR